MITLNKISCLFFDIRVSRLHDSNKVKIKEQLVSPLPHGTEGDDCESHKHQCSNNTKQFGFI